MNQMTHLGTTLFDIGKGAIDQFLRVSVNSGLFEMLTFGHG